MKTKKFFMTSLLVMGMIIAKAANGFAPELVLVSQPVLTYDANSVTIYYDLLNIGDYAYKGDIYIYLDPDNGYYYARKYVKVCPGRIKRVAISIPAYRPNPSWMYTVMPYYELGNELYSFTTFEYFEPVSFCWNGYRNEPWVVIHVGPKPRRYYRPGDYRYYYDGYRPMIPPPPPGGWAPGHGPAPTATMPPMDPMHHTYGYHHIHGGYPASYHPEGPVPGYNHVMPNDHGNGFPGGHPGGNPGGNPSGSGNATVVPHGSNTPGSSSSGGTGSNTNTSNNSSATTRPSGNSNSSGSSATTRPSGNSNGNSSATTRPSGNSNSGSSSGSGSSSVSRPSGNSSSTGTSSSGTSSSGNSSSSGRTGSTNSNVSRPSGNSSNTGTSNSGTSSSGRSGNSSNSGSGRSDSGSSNSSSSGNSSRTGNTPSRGR